MGNCGGSEEAKQHEELNSSQQHNEPSLSNDEAREKIKKIDDELLALRKQLSTTRGPAQERLKKRGVQLAKQKKLYEDRFGKTDNSNNNNAEAIFEVEKTDVTSSTATSVQKEEQQSSPPTSSSNPDAHTDVDIERAERIFKGVQAVSSAEYYTWRAKEALSGNEETIANAAVKLLDKADFEKDWQNAKVGIFISALLTGAAESVPAPFKGVVTAISGIVKAVVAISANKYMAKQLADRLVSLHPAIFIMIKNKYPDSENLCKRLLNVIGHCQEILDAFSDLGEGAGFLDKLKQKWGQFSKSAEDFNECHNKIDQIVRDITFSTVQQELVGARQRPSRENLEESFRKETAEIISSITNHIDVKLDAKDSLDEERSQSVLANISDLTRRVNILLERAGEKDVDALSALTSSYQLQDGELPGSVVTRVPRKAALGSGARATVYEGVFKKEIPVAMKEYRGTPTLVAALARAEYDLLKKLQSVNDVIRVYGIRSGSNELVMEKLDYSLEDFLAGGRCYQNGQRLNMEQKLSITMCLIRALRSLHAMSPKVIVGDIKPSNLLLTDSHYAVKMIDFGSAATRMTTMISAKGITDEAEEYSIPFAAPELLSRGTRAEATDIYAFAVTLLELWSEDHAYKNESDVQKRVVEQGLRPTFSSAASSSCPEVIRRVIEWCWVADSNLRPDAFKLNELRKLWAESCHASASQFFTLRPNQWPLWMQNEAPSSLSGVTSNHNDDNDGNFPDWMNDLDATLVSPKHKRTLCDQQIATLDVFIDLTDDDLRELFKEIGARKIIRNEINRLKLKKSDSKDAKLSEKINFLPLVEALRSKNTQEATQLLTPHLVSQAAIENLVKQHNDSDFKSNDGRNLLHIAVTYNQSKILSLLLVDEKGQNNSRDLFKQMIGEYNKLGYTPLMIACQQKLEECAEVMIRNCLSVKQLELKSRETKSNAQFTALHHAAYSDNVKILRLLVAVGGASTEVRTASDFTPLHTSCFVGALACVEFLLGNEIPKKADVNSETVRGSTPLFIAVERENLELVKLLIDRFGANKNFITPPAVGQFSILHHAAFHGRDKSLEFLLKDESIVQQHLERPSASGMTPLLAAVAQGHVKCAQVLLAKGANKGAKTYQGKDGVALARSEQMKKLFK